MLEERVVEEGGEVEEEEEEEEDVEEEDDDDELEVCVADERAGEVEKEDVVVCGEDIAECVNGEEERE